MQPSFSGLQQHIGVTSLRRRTYVSYVLLLLCILAGMTLCTYILFATDIWWVQLGNALLIGFLFVQVGMLGHDCSHKQVFMSERANQIGGLIFWSLGVGLSEEGWYQKHNAHHKHVNRLGHDPDLGIPFVFSEKQYGTQRRLFARFVRPHQDLLFLVLLPFVYFNFVVWSVRGLMRTLSWRHLLEALLMGVHFALFIALPFSALPVYTALMVLVVMHIFGGAYMGLAFAPNHKGMPVKSAHEETVWTDQITLTRNLWPSRTHFIFWGGLNFQIEHHLFPTTSRFLYPKIQPMVKAYCLQHGISYHETTWRNAMKEIFVSLQKHKA